MSKKGRIILILGIVIAAAVVLYAIINTRTRADSDGIRVSGNIEITDAEVSFKIPGRVEKRLVSEGQSVKSGQVIAMLDQTELAQEVALRRAEERAAQSALAELTAGSRPEEIAQAEAGVQKAQARLDELLAGSRPQEVAVATAAVEKAQADLARLKTDFERQKQLYDRDVISAREFEASRTAYEIAGGRLREDAERLKLVREGPRGEEIEQARATLREAGQRHALVKKGPRRETIDQARARLGQVQEARAMAETRLGYATLVSPLSGVVLSENVEAGEHVAPGMPVVTVGGLDNVWLRAYINESDLGRVKIGQRVRVTTDSYPGKTYEGRISFISSQAEFTPKNVQTDKERVKLVYRVKADFANPTAELKAGMPADAVIMTGGATE
jgi:HlyD family secretion protein